MAGLATRLKNFATGTPAQRPQTTTKNTAKIPPFAEPNGEKMTTADMLGMSRYAGGGNAGVALFHVDGIQRNRAMIYHELLVMSLDPLIHTCLSALVTAALGGDAQEGKSIFIEYVEPVFTFAGETVALDGEAEETQAQKNAKLKAEIKKKRLTELRMQRVREIAADLEPMINNAIFTMAMNAATFGDAYVRPYFVEGLGILSLYADELVSAPMVEPFERAGKTEAYLVQGENFGDVVQLHAAQMTRAKMPRTAYMPQIGMVNELAHANLAKDDPADHDLAPSLVGGSLLAFVEKPFQRLQFTLNLMSTQNVRMAVEENLVLLKTQGMDRKQVKTAIDNLTGIFERGWSALRKVFESGEIPKGNITHILPVKDGDQIAFPETGAAFGTNVQNLIPMEQIFFAARQVAGTLGLDLSIAGFADQMSGGLGEGGFFRVSVQQAQNAISIRQACTPAIEDLIRIHYFYKYGEDIEPSEKFWAARYYAGISAMQSEAQDTALAQMQTGSTMLGALEQMKTANLSEATMVAILTTQFNQNETLAKQIAHDIAQAPKEEAGGFGG